MKKRIIYFAITLSTLLTACSPEEYSSPDLNAIPVAADYEDCISVSVDQETNTAYFRFSGAEGVTPVWIIDGTSYNSDFTAKKYYRKAGTYTVECKVKNANGISDGAISRSFTIDKTIMVGFAGMDPESDYNLFKTATLQSPTFWYAPGWAQIADPTYTRSGNDWTVKLPEATTDQWQAQMFITTDVAVNAGTHYDYSVIFTSNTDHPHVTMKLGSASDSNFGLCYVPNISLTAGEPYCFYFHDVECTQNVNDLQLIFDFGGNAANTEIVIESLAIKDSSNDDGTVWPSDDDNTVYTYNAETNLWLPVDKEGAYTMTYYYAPDWQKIADPTFTGSNGVYTVKLPQATWQRWQAQVAMHVNVAVEAGQEYDFSVTFHTNKSLAGVTAKLASDVTGTDADDGNFLETTDGPFAVESDYVLKVHNAKFTQGEASKIKLVFDFAPCDADTEIEISNIILQKHRD